MDRAIISRGEHHVALQLWYGHWVKKISRQRLSLNLEMPCRLIQSIVIITLFQIDPLIFFKDLQEMI